MWLHQKYVWFCWGLKENKNGFVTLQMLIRCAQHIHLPEFQALLPVSCDFIAKYFSNIWVIVFESRSIIPNKNQFPFRWKENYRRIGNLWYEKCRIWYSPCSNEIYLFGSLKIDECFGVDVIVTRQLCRLMTLYTSNTKLSWHSGFMEYQKQKAIYTHTTHNNNRKTLRCRTTWNMC